LKGYWQVPLTEKASVVSAFATPDVFLQYRVMGFGLELFSICVTYCDAYLNDLVCYSDSWDECSISQLCFSTCCH